MTRVGDCAYYAARAAEERELSEAAMDPVVAGVHARLAEGYERLTSTRPGSRPILRIVTG